MNKITSDHIFCGLNHPVFEKGTILKKAIVDTEVRYLVYGNGCKHCTDCFTCSDKSRCADK